MNEENIEIAKAKVRKNRFSIIWLIPLITALLGCWMVYQHYMERGVKITILFDSGEGIVAGKTLIKYEGIEIGIVNSVELSRKNNKIIAAATLKKSAAHIAKNGSLFWIVKPRLAVGGISGLETIITGQYIKVRPGNGETAYTFMGLEFPPPSSPDAPGLHITLESDNLGSLMEGSPVLHRKISVGRVESHKLSTDEKNVLIDIYIFPEFSKLVRKNTRFWNASGVEISAGLSDFRIKTESITSMLDGGISFDSPEFEEPGTLSENGDTFTLHKDKASAMERGYPIKVIFDTAEGITPGTTPVKYKGLTIGKVTSVDIAPDPKKIIVSILLKERAKAAAKEGSLFWMVRPTIDVRGLSGLSTIFFGPYIELRPGKGRQATIFEGLPNPPFSDPEAPGLHIVLHAEDSSSLGEGSPVLYRGIEVGEIEGVELGNGGENVAISAYIYENYAPLVRKNSNFWNISGIDINAAITGIRVNTESLTSMISGGIAFDTPSDNPGEQCESSDCFTLHDSREAAIEKGVTVQVSFTTGEGLIAGNTELRCRGVKVGYVKEVKLEKDLSVVNTKVFIDESASMLAREESRFILVGPEAGPNGIKGLDTLITGRYIEVVPGGGYPATAFTGESGTNVKYDKFSGLKVVLEADNLGSLSSGKPVYYRQVKVGEVLSTRLSDNSDYVLVDIGIENKYAPLVRRNSKFWYTGALSVDVSLFGAKMKTETLESLISGGVAFATPNNKTMDEEAGDGYIFRLYKEPDKKWLKWRPVISLSEENIGN